MNRVRPEPVARFGAIRRTKPTGARLIATLAMLLGTLTVGLQSAAAQSGGDSFTYDEDGLEWSISWDGDTWSEGESDSADLSLEAAGSFVQFVVLTPATEDPAECLANVVPSFEEGAGAIEADAFEDDNGDPVLDETADYAYELRTISVDLDGEEIGADVIHACYVLGDDALLWGVGLIPVDLDELDDALELFDGVEIAGEPVELGLLDIVSGTGGGTGEDEATPEASDDDEETPEASDEDEATPEASDDEETPEASDEDDVDSSDSDDAGPGADEDAGTYTSPTFGYSLEWDADAYMVENDQTVDTYQLGRDFLQLNNTDTSSILFVEGDDDSWSDTDDCVATLLDEVEVDPDDGELLDDANGDPFEISDDERSAAAYLVTVTLDDGDESDEIVMVDCRLDPNSDVIVGFTNRSGFVDSYIEDDYPAVEEILDSLAFGGTGDGTPEASDDEQPSDDAEPSDEAEVGVDGSTYISPTYFYMLSWDEEIWTVEDESSEDEVDALTLSSDLLTMNLVGYNSGDGDPETCLDNYLTVLDDRGDGDAEIVTDPDTGDELVFPSDDGDSLDALLIYSVDGENFASLVTCISLDDESIVGLEFTAPGVDVVSDDATDQIDGIFDGLFVL